MTRIYCKKCDAMSLLIVAAKERDPLDLDQAVRGDITCTRWKKVCLPFKK